MRLPEDAIEAAAKAEWEFCGPSYPGATWETDSSDYVDYLWRGAERALKAAAPHLAAEAWDEGWEAGLHFTPNDANPYRSQA